MSNAPEIEAQKTAILIANAGLKTALLEIATAERRVWDAYEPILKAAIDRKDLDLAGWLIMDVPGASRLKPLVTLAYHDIEKAIESEKALNKKTS